MATERTNRKVVVNNCLCFLTNKLHKVGSFSLKSLLVSFYTEEELFEARDILLYDVEGLKLDDSVKVGRRRRFSNGRGMADLEDVINTLTTLDEKQLLDKLSIYASTDPDRMPYAGLVEGDLAILWSKLSDMSDMIVSLKASMEVSTNLHNKHAEHMKSIQAAIKEFHVAIGKNPASDFPPLPAAGAHRPTDYRGSYAYPPLGRPTVANVAASASEIGVSGAYDQASGVSANMLAQVERGTDRSHAGGTLGWGSAVSESIGRTDSDSDTDKRPFIEVASKNTKRKNRSPGDQVSMGELEIEAEGRTAKKMNMGAATGYSEAASLPFITGAASNRTHTDRTDVRRAGGSGNPARITGNSTRPTALQAGDKSNVVEKATFCVSNVGMNYSVKDIRRHCSDMDIKVLFCFDISSVEATSRAFKLAVPATAIDSIMNPEAWPSRVSVRLWNSNRYGDTQERRMEDVRHQRGGYEESGVDRGEHSGAQQQQPSRGGFGRRIENEAVFHDVSDRPLALSSDVENGTSMPNEMEIGLDGNSSRGIEAEVVSGGKSTTVFNRAATGSTVAGGSDAVVAPLSTLGLASDVSHATAQSAVISETTPSDIGNSSNASILIVNQSCDPVMASGTSN